MKKKSKKWTLRVSEPANSPDIEVALGEDVEFLRGHPLIFSDTMVSGWVYDVETGKVSAFGLCGI